MAFFIVIWKEAMSSFEISIKISNSFFLQRPPIATFKALTLN